jgi:hypothetical protein
MRSHGVAKHQRAHVLSLEIVGHNQLKADFARDFGKKVFLHRDRALSGAFALRRSYRDVEDLLAERGLTVSNESIRRWVLKFGPIIAGNLRENRPKPYTRWHLDEMVVSIAGRQMYMWRAVDSEGEVLEAQLATPNPATVLSGASRLDHCCFFRQSSLSSAQGALQATFKYQFGRCSPNQISAQIAYSWLICQCPLRRSHLTSMQRSATLLRQFPPSRIAVNHGSIMHVSLP